MGMAILRKFSTIEILMVILIGCYKTNGQTPPELVSFDMTMTPPVQLILTFSVVVDPATCVGSTITLLNSADYTTATFNHTFQGVNCSYPLGDKSGFSVTVEPSPQDSRALQCAIDTATSTDNTFIILAANFIQSTIGDPSVEIDSPLQVDLFVSNLNPPTILAATLDLNSGSLSITLSEAVQLNTFDPSSVTISFSYRSFYGSDSYRLTGGLTSYIDMCTIAVSLSFDDINFIKTYSQEPYSLGLASGAFRDGNNQGNIAIDNFLITAIPDTIRPFLESFSLDLNTGELSLFFAEPVQLADSGISTVRLISSASSDPQGTEYSFVPIEPRPQLTIIVSLTSIALNAIKSDTGLCTSRENCYLAITSYSVLAISDVQGNPIFSTVIRVNSYTLDVSTPQLENYNIDFAESIIVLEFSEAISEQTFQPDGVILYDFNRTNSLTLINSTLISTSIYNTFFILMIDSPTLSTLETYNTEGGTLLALSGSTASDSSFNFIEEIPSTNLVPPGPPYILCTADLTPPLNGSVEDYSIPAVSGEQVTFRCDNGLLPTDVMTSTCTDVRGRGEWVPDPAQLVCREPVRPELIFFELNMTPPEQLVLTFSERVDPSSCVGSALTLSSDRIGSSTYTFTAVSCSYPIGDTSGLSVIVEPSPQDWRNIQDDINLATSSVNTYLSLQTNFIQSVDGGSNVEISPFSPIIVGAFTSNVNPPFVLTASLDLNRGLIELVLSEAVQSSSLDPTGVSISYSDRIIGSAGSITLTGSNTQSADGSTIVVSLFIDELNILQSFSQAPYFLSLTSDSFQDGNNQGNIAVDNIMFSSVIPDTTSPSLHVFTFDLDVGVIFLSFNEPVQFTNSSFSMLQLDNNQGSNYYLQGSELLSPAGPNIEAIIALNPTVLNAVKSNSELCTYETNCFLNIMDASISDIQGNNLNKSSVIFSATSFIYDTTPPEPVNLYIDFNNSLLILEFSEAINASTFDVTGITLHNFDQTSQFTLSFSTVISFFSRLNTLFILTLEAADLNRLEMFENEGGIRLTMSQRTATDFSGNQILEIFSSFPVSPGRGYTLCTAGLTPPSNGNVGYFSVPAASGTQVTFSCDDRLFPTGVMTSTCTDVGGRGEWVPDPAQLVCREPVRPELISFELNMTPPEQLVLTFNEMVDPSSCAGSALTLYTGSYFRGDTSSYTFQYVDCSSLHGGLSVIVEPSPQDWRNIQGNIDLATSVNNTFISLDASFVQSATGGGSVATSRGLQVARFIPNLNPPSVLMATLDLNRGSLILVLSEAVQLNSFNPEGVGINYQDRISGHVGILFLIDANAMHLDVSTVKISLDDNDLNTLKYFSQAPYSLGLISQAFFDGNGQGNIAVDNYTISSLIPDTSPPSLRTFSIDLNEGLLHLTFDEPVEATDAGISTIRLVSSFEPQDTGYSLINTIIFSSFTVLRLQLSSMVLNAVKSDTRLCVSLDNCYLAVTSESISDIQGNTITSTVVRANEFLSDFTPPVLVNYTIDFTDNLVILEFSEPVDEGIFLPEEITLFDSNRTNSLTLFNSTILFTLAFNSLFLLSIDASTLSTLEMYQNEGGILLALSSDTAFDSNFNPIFPIPNTDPLSPGPPYILCFAGLVPPANGSVGDYSVPALSGEQVTFRCNNGLLPTGVMISTCTDVGGRGEWVPDPAQLMCNVPVYPELISFELNMTPPEQLVLTFSEIVDPSSCADSALTLYSGSFIDAGISSYNFQHLNCSYPISDNSGRSVLVDIPPEDWRNIQGKLDLATFSDNTFISVAENFIQSTTGGGSIETDRPLQAAIFTPNLNPPSVSMASLDFNSELLTLELSEAIQSNSFDPSGISINYNDRTTGSAGSFTFSSTVPFSYVGLTIQLILSTDDLNSVKFYSQEPYSLGLASDTFLDGNDQGNTAVGNFMFSSVIFDDIPPNLLEFSIDLTLEIVTLTFDEPVRTVDSGLSTLGLVSSPIAQGTGYSLINSQLEFPAGPSTLLFVRLDSADLNAIKTDRGLCVNTASCYLVIANESISDIQGNTLTSALVTATDFIPDTVPPVLVNYNIDFTDSLIVLDFSEAIDELSFQPDGITLFDSNRLNPLTLASSRVLATLEHNTIYILTIDASILSTLETYQNAGGTLLILRQNTATDYFLNRIVSILVSPGPGYILCTAGLTPPLNGTVGDYSVPASSGTQVTFSCDNGLLPTGVMTSTCTDVGGRGEWVPDPAQLVCRVPAVCQVPVEPLHGSVLGYCELPTIEGSIITFKCDPDFSPVAEMTATCTSSGQWSTEPSQLMCSWNGTRNDTVCDPGSANPFGQLQPVEAVGVSVAGTFAASFLAGMVAGACMCCLFSRPCKRGKSGKKAETKSKNVKSKGDLSHEEVAPKENIELIANEV